MGKIQVAGKQDLEEGTQEGEPLLSGYRSGGTRGSHPGIKVPHLPPGVRQVFHSTGGLREPGGEPLLGEYRSGGTRGSHPGIKVPRLPPGVRLVFHSPRGLREPGGGAPLGRSTDQVVPVGSHPGIKVPDLSPGVRRKSHSPEDSVLVHNTSFIKGARSRYFR